jgi:hypothetical protein
MIREKFRKAQAERNREINQKRRELFDHDSDSDIEPLPHKKQPPSKTIRLSKGLQNTSRQALLDQITDKENKEMEFEPLTQRLDRAEKTDKLTII